MTDDCILTTNVSIDKDGYPRIKFNKRIWRLNRFVYTLVHGEIPTNMVIGHSCNNKGCINPHHLYLTTSAQNSTDAARDGLYFTGHHNQHLEKASKDWLTVNKMYNEHGFSQNEIGKIYGVSQSRISEILRKTKHQYQTHCGLSDCDNR